MNWGKHFQRWWILYAIIAAMVIVNLAMLAKEEVKEKRAKALANPQMMADNYELVATIDDCKVYQLISQKYVKVVVCQTSHASIAAF